MNTGCKNSFLDYICYRRENKEMMGRAELIYFLIVVALILIVSLKVKINVYKYFILFVLIVPLIPSLLIIGAIRKMEYRKEFLNEINFFDEINNEVISGECKIDGSNDIVKALKGVRPFMANHSSPRNFVELQLGNKSRRIKIIIGSDSIEKEELWIFFRKREIGRIQSVKLYNEIYFGNCSKKLIESVIEM